PDGSIDQRMHGNEGTVEHTIIGPDGYGTTTLTDPDGNTMVLDEYPDPALQVDGSATPPDEPPVLDGTDSPLFDEMPILGDAAPIGDDSHQFDDGDVSAGDVDLYALTPTDESEEPTAYEEPVDMSADTGADLVTEGVAD